MPEPVYPDTPDNAIEFLKVPPFSIEAEQSVLGGLMLNNEAWFSIADLIEEGDFYRPEHQLIFKAIKSLSEEGHPCDVVTLSEWLVRHDQLETVGGLSYLGQLAKNTPSAANIVAYTDIVRERSILRQLVRVGQDIANQAFNPQGRNSAQLLDHAETLVFKIAEQGFRRRGGFTAVKELLPATLERIEILSKQEGMVTGVATGFMDFDRETSGLQPSDLIIVAGRPSMGKCITGDSKIALSDGRLVTIEELCRGGQAQLLSLNEAGQFYLTQPIAFMDNGEQSVFGVTTRLGRYIETTVQHPYLTSQGWRPLSQLSVGQKIAVPKQIKIFGTTILAEAEVKLLSYWTAGKYDYFKPSKPLLTNLHSWLRTEIQEAILQISPNSGKNSKTLAEILHLERKFIGQKIPSTVFTLSRSQLALFLSHLFATSNGVNLNPKGKASVRYSHANESLVKDLQHLLLRFGILATLTRSRRAAQVAWHLKITEPSSLLIFIREIGIFTKEQVLAKLQEVLLSAGGAQTDTIARSDSIGNLTTDAIADSDSIGQTNDTDIYWDRIISIEYQGVKRVYDLTIPDTHNFVANDICVHNTSFAMNVAEYVAVEKKLPVAVFSMEMSSEQLMMRLLSSIAKVELQKVRTGKLLNDDDWANLTRNLHRLEESQLFIDDTPALNPTELRLRARRLAREQGQLGLIVIDYLQLMQIPDTKESRANEVSEISRSLKSLAKELNTPIMALSQLNRSLEQRPEKRPRMSDLRESGSIEQDADLIVFIYRDEVYNEDTEDKGIAEIIIAKQRNGPIGTVKLTFMGQYTKFGNYTPDNYYGE